jgi:hypothetical protein
MIKSIASAETTAIARSWNDGDRAGLRCAYITTAPRGTFACMVPAAPNCISLLNCFAMLGAFKFCYIDSGCSCL